MKVKVQDAQRAVEILRRDFIKSTGLDGEDISAVEVVFSQEAETVICPACSASFKPTSTNCPDCGLQFG